MGITLGKKPEGKPKAKNRHTSQITKSTVSKLNEDVAPTLQSDARTVSPTLEDSHQSVLEISSNAQELNVKDVVDQPVGEVKLEEIDRDAIEDGLDWKGDEKLPHTYGELDEYAEGIPMSEEILTDVEEDITMAKARITFPAPDFCGTAVVNGQFKEIKLADYKGKYLVLFFYPFDFTFVCPTEIIAFSDRAEEFQKINCELIACSMDSHFSHLAWINTSRKEGGLGGLNIPLLADKTGQVTKDYGCFKEDEGVSFRGLYIIDDKGRLRQITINDLPVGRSVDETLRLVQAFQYTDVHGEVCPANWKPGSATMKPNPKDSKAYFESH